MSVIPLTYSPHPFFPAHSTPLLPSTGRCLNLRCTDASSCRSLSNNITVVVVDDCPAPACTAPGDVQLNSFAFRHAAAR